MPGFLSVFWQVSCSPCWAKHEPNLPLPLVTEFSKRTPQTMYLLPVPGIHLLYVVNWLIIH